MLSILGRQFEYGTALEIIQDESYLQESDFNDIKRKDIKKEIKFAIPNIKNDISPDFKDWNNRKKWEPIRKKRSVPTKKYKELPYNHYSHFASSFGLELKRQKRQGRCKTVLTVLCQKV